MAIGDIPAGYWVGPRNTLKSPVVRAHKISKTAWMDLYYDLYQQTHGEDVTTEDVVIADAEDRLQILKANGIRR